VSRTRRISHTPLPASLPNPGSITEFSNVLNAVSAEYSSAQHKYELQLNVVEHFEWQHGIQTRWSPDDPEYVAVQEYAKHCTFICVVEELEGLVVQRLFELSKANLAGTSSYFASSPS
jgi:hypothetical protein